MCVVLGGGDGNSGGGDGKVSYWVVKRNYKSGSNVSSLRIPRGYARTLHYSPHPRAFPQQGRWRGGIRLDTPAIS